MYQTTHVQAVRLETQGSLRLQQGGSDVAPSSEVLLLLQPRSKADGFAKAAFALTLGSFLFLPAPTFDEVIDLGYNVTSSVPDDPTARFSIESAYQFQIGPDKTQMEMHGQFSTLGGGGGTTYRWLTASFRPDTYLNGTNLGLAALQWSDGTVGPADPGFVIIQERTASTSAAKFETAGSTFYNTGFVSMTALGAWLMTGGAQTSNIPPNSMVFAPQTPFAGAIGVANRTPANYEINLGIPLAGGAEANFLIRRGANIVYETQPGSTTWADAAGTAYFEIVLSGASTQLVGVSAGTMYVSNNNGALQLTATTGVYLLANGGDQCHFYVNGVELAQIKANGVASQTSLVVACDVGNTLNRVTLGIANSGGLGFRAMIVPN